MVTRAAFATRIAAAAFCTALMGLPLAAAAQSSTGRASTPAPMQVDKTQLALGEALTLSLSRALTAPGPALSDLDLNALHSDFEIHGRSHGSDAQRESLTFTLYARRTGRFTLPRWGGLARPLVVEVTAGSATLPEVGTRWLLDPPDPVARQSSRLSLEVCDDGTLQWRRPMLAAGNGYSLRPLDESQHAAALANGQACKARRWHWALLPTAAGAVHLQPPVLQASKFGQPLRFWAPTLNAEVRPVPAWLPGEVAVGRVSIEALAPEAPAEPKSARALVGQPLLRRFVVSGDYGAPALRELLQAQLAPHADWAAYPPAVQPLPAESAMPQHEVSLFGLPRERGTMERPALRLPWFDPVSRRLQLAQLPAEHIAVADPAREWRQRALTIAASVVSVALVLGAFSWIFAWRIRRWRFARAVRACKSLDELHDQVLRFDLHRATPAAPTLALWQARMTRQSRSAGLAELVASLQGARYGRAAQAAGPSLPRFQSALLQWLRGLRPTRAWPGRAI